jgi:hypothetical protein
VRITDLSPDTALDGAESKDPEGACFTHAVRSFSTTEAREQDLARPLQDFFRSGSKAVPAGTLYHFFSAGVTHPFVQDWHPRFPYERNFIKARTLAGISLPLA